MRAERKGRQKQGRERLGSRLGFILLSAGCAIGIGNVWKFPYIAGANGGAIFILIYLFFLAVLGIPVMTMEFAMGRAAQASPALLYQKLEPKGSKWHWHTWFAVAGNYLLMMFYTTVAGWMLKYFADMAAGRFEQLNPGQITDQFASMMKNPGIQIFYMGIVVAAGFAVCAAGLQNGLERITKWMMSALLILMIVLALHSLFLEGAQSGIAYYLLPDWNRFMEIGPLNVISAAMNQAFFTLSLGIGAMAIFGSYIGKERSLLGESLSISLLDTLVALAAGLIIIPACFAYGVDAGAGPSLIFITLPNLFAQMPFSRVWGALFFLFMSFAAFSTVLAVFENILSSCMDAFGWSRKKACLINALLIFALSIPCAAGFDDFAGILSFGKLQTMMDFEDFLVSNILLPGGSLIFVLFCTWDFGWGWDSFRAEANQGSGLKVPQWLHPYCKFVLPLIILVILIAGLL